MASDDLKCRILSTSKFKNISSTELRLVVVDVDGLITIQGNQYSTTMAESIVSPTNNKSFWSYDSQVAATSRELSAQSAAHCAVEIDKSAGGLFHANGMRKFTCFEAILQISLIHQSNNSTSVIVEIHEEVLTELDWLIQNPATTALLCHTNHDGSGASGPYAHAWEQF